MKSELDAKITIGLGIAIFLLLAALKGPKFSEDILSVASSAISATVIFRFLFIKWIWKWIPFAICRVPFLEGEWKGGVESTGNDKTPADRTQVKVDVSIIQPDMFSVKVIRRSDESASTSFGEILTNESDGTVELLYSYRSEPNAMVRDRSPISYGTARLRTNLKDLESLKGDYWTDQKTTGVLSLKRKK